MSIRDQAPASPIVVGDEVVFLWPSQAVPGLTNIDAHHDVLEIRDGMVGVARTIRRGQPRSTQPTNWAPLTAVKHTSNGHRCPEPQGRTQPEGGTR